VIPSVRRRFWLEAGLGVAAVALLLLTAAIPDWIEVIFGVEPDEGNGSFERVLVAALAACAISFSMAARREWRRGALESPDTGESGRG
jgi:hypothetical protein